MSRLTKKQLIADEIFTIEGVLDAEECGRLIESSEAIGYQAATVETGLGSTLQPEWRNNGRVIIDDVECAEQVWQRVVVHIPARIGNWQPIGTNERLRFYRYEVGQQFDWHSDGYFARENGQRSRMTLMIYLNEGFEGGGTSFRDEDSGRFTNFTVKPRTGMALLFRHEVTHRGDPVIAGRKYVLRTDIMAEPCRYAAK